jgi:DNA-directed RNA polymerase subunit RPC12/RpoP
MKDVIACPRCGRKLELPDDQVGKSVQCPTCGTTFIGRPAPAAPASLPSVSLPPTPRISPPVELPTPPIRMTPAAHRGGMILTFGMLSLLPCILTSVLFGVLAWNMGSSDLHAMREGTMHPEGEGLTVTGRSIGLVGILLWSIVWFFGCIALIR